MLERLSKYAFAAFVFLLPVQTVLLLREPFVDGAKWQYGTIGLYGTDVLLVIVCALYLSASLRNRAMRLLPVKLFDKRIPLQAEETHENCHGISSRSPLEAFLAKSSNGRKAYGPFPIDMLLLLGLLILAGISIVWAGDRVLAAYTFAKLAMAFGAFVLAQSLDGKGVRWAVAALAAGALLESLLGAWQFLAQASFASKWLGMNGYDAWQAGVSVLKNDSGRWLRAYGTFPHPNILGAYLGAAFLAGIGHIVFRKQKSKAVIPALEPESPSLSLGSRITSGMTIAWIVTVLLGLLLSFSRSAWLGVLVGSCALAYAVFVRNDTETKRRFLKLAGIVVLAAAILAAVLHEVIFPRFDGTVIDREASVTDRAALTRQAVGIIRKHPLLGVGAGNYTLAVMHGYPDMPVWDAQPVHNVLLLTWAELGIFGVLAFVGFLSIVLFNGWKSLRQESQKENAIFFIAFLSVVPSLLLDHFLWDSHFGILFFFLLVGLSLRDKC
jgi:hypothetical protein